MQPGQTENLAEGQRKNARKAMRTLPRSASLTQRLGCQSDRFLSLQKIDDLGQLPNVIGQARSHRGRHADRGVNPREIVVDKMHRAREAVILQFLRKAICEPRESAHLHPHREIVPLAVAGANGVGIWVAEHNITPRAQADARAVFSLAQILAVELHQHSIIDGRGKESGFDRDDIGAKPVRRKLDSVRESRLKVAHEIVGALCAAIPRNIPARNQLRVGVDGNPRPNVARAGVLKIGGNVALLGVAKAPNFIALDSLAGEAPENPVGEFFARLSKLNSETLDSFLGDASDSYGCADAVALDKAGKHSAAIFVLEPIHLTGGLDSGLVFAGAAPFKHSQSRSVCDARNAIPRPSFLLQAEICNCPQRESHGLPGIGKEVVSAGTNQKKTPLVEVPINFALDDGSLPVSFDFDIQDFHFLHFFRLAYWASLLCRENTQRWVVWQQLFSFIFEGQNMAENIDRNQSSPTPKIERVKVMKKLVSSSKPITAPRAKAVIESIAPRPIGGLAAMAMAERSNHAQPEIDLNLKPKMTPGARVQAYATVSEWWEANKTRCLGYPAVPTAQVVQQIIALFA